MYEKKVQKKVSLICRFFFIATGLNLTCVIPTRAVVLDLTPGLMFGLSVASVVQVYLLLP